MGSFYEFLIINLSEIYTVYIKNFNMTKFNDFLAMNATKIFGTMWTTYIFFIYGLMPLFFPECMDKLLYWSNTIQLWSLPLLMVGTNLLGRKAEIREQETHDIVMAELQLLKDEIKQLCQLRQCMDTIQQTMNKSDENNFK